MFTHKGIDELSSELKEMKHSIELKQKLLTDLLGIYKWVKFTMSVDDKEDVVISTIYVCPDVEFTPELKNILLDENMEIYVYGRNWNENYCYVTVMNFLETLTEHIDYVMFKE